MLAGFDGFWAELTEQALFVILIAEVPYHAIVVVIQPFGREGVHDELFPTYWRGVRELVLGVGGQAILERRRELAMDRSLVGNENRESISNGETRFTSGAEKEPCVDIKVEVRFCYPALVR